MNEFSSSGDWGGEGGGGGGWFSQHPQDYIIPLLGMVCDCGLGYHRQNQNGSEIVEMGVREMELTSLAWVSEPRSELASKPRCLERI